MITPIEGQVYVILDSDGVALCATFICELERGLGIIWYLFEDQTGRGIILKSPAEICCEL